MAGNFYTWVNQLSEADKQIMLIRAAKEHKFTNPQEVGMSWTKTLNRAGYSSLCPLARNFLAHEYLKAQNEMAA